MNVNLQITMKNGYAVQKNSNHGTAALYAAVPLWKSS
jgi:hypothetical protein